MGSHWVRDVLHQLEDVKTNINCCHDHMIMTNWLLQLCSEIIYCFISGQVGPSEMLLPNSNKCFISLGLGDLSNHRMVLLNSALNFLLSFQSLWFHLWFCPRMLPTNFNLFSCQACFFYSLGVIEIPDEKVFCLQMPLSSDQSRAQNCFSKYKERNCEEVISWQSFFISTQWAGGTWAEGMAEEHGLHSGPMRLFRTFRRQKVMKSALTWTGRWPCAPGVSCLNWTPREGGEEMVERK